ncbi:hypothetical protein HPB47_005365 [Ixodes persulcatus]|uniref:Uncharacterized protein n=1 Tax=Ixodes persulcatus TaxID=34615 RepID=A0AC60PDC6_IXOPE|nr:hypothetical protein HPB47_005365 [Ixodes persulcatus]
MYDGDVGGMYVMRISTKQEMGTAQRHLFEKRVPPPRAGASRRPGGRREIQGPANALTQVIADAQSASPDLPYKEHALLKIQQGDRAGVPHVLSRSGMVTPNVGTSAAATGEQPMYVPSQVGHADEAGVHSIGCHGQTCRKLAEAMIKKERASHLMAQPEEGAINVPYLGIKSADNPPVRRAAASFGRAWQNEGGIHTPDVGTLFSDALEKATVVGKCRPDTGGGEVVRAQMKNQAGNTSVHEVQKMLAVQDRTPSGVQTLAQH